MNTATSTRYTNSVLQAVILIPVLPKICSMYWNTWTNTATYDWKVNDHAFKALIGMESYQYNGTYLSGSNSSLKEGFDDWEHAYISNGTASSTASGLGVSGYPLDENRTVSYFVRFGWN